MIPSKTDSNLGVKEYLRDIPLVLKVLLFFSVAVNIIFAYNYCAKPDPPVPADPFVVTKELFQEFQSGSELDDESKKEIQNLVNSMCPCKGRFETVSTFLHALYVEMLKAVKEAKDTAKDTEDNTFDYEGFKNAVKSLNPTFTDDQVNSLLHRIGGIFTMIPGFFEGMPRSAQEYIHLQRSKHEEGFNEPFSAFFPDREPTD
eukprot:728282_1